MKIQSIEFKQFEKEKKNKWDLKKFKIGNINLIVGKNASGKSRTLNIIGTLANLVSGDRKGIPNDGVEYIVEFDDNGRSLEYILSYDDNKILKEKLVLNKTLLDRKKGGKGVIWAEELNTEMKFQVPENTLACVARRDEVQHPFFEILYDWGKSYRHFYFGTSLGRDNVIIHIEGEEKEKKFNIKDTNLATYYFNKGLIKYKEKFKKELIKDLENIGYHIEDFQFGKDPHVKVEGPIEPPYFLMFKETDLRKPTYQLETSQGMFRALSILIQINFYIFEKQHGLILIDDIGEGLDYERSTSLINVLIEKVKKNDIQLIMSTNDRFVMNEVPLEYWAIIQRKETICKIYNYENSKKIFDEFKYTGLSNFDFFSTEFYSEGFDKE